MMTRHRLIDALLALAACTALAPAAALAGVGWPTPVFPGAPITVPTITFTGPAAAPTFQFPTDYSTAELMLTGGTAGQNVLQLYNSNKAGFDALTVRDPDTQLERLTLGYANSLTSYIATNAGFLEISSFPLTGTTPPPYFKFVRTGYINGSLQTVESARIENNTGTDGQWYWDSLISTSQGVFIIDPLHDFVTVNNELLVGNLNSARTPVVAIDNYGHTATGGSTSTRSTLCAAWVYCGFEGTSNMLRLVHDGVVKMDLLISAASATGAQFTDTDHSGVVPLAMALDGSASITAGGSIIAASLATAGTIAGSICRTAGGIILYESGASGCTISLEELKKDIARIPLVTAFREAMAFDPISYEMTADDPQGPRFGFGARQVNAVDSRLGVIDGNKDLQSYDPNGVLAVSVRLLQAVQYQVLVLWALAGGLAVMLIRTRRRLRRLEIAVSSR